MSRTCCRLVPALVLALFAVACGDAPPAGPPGSGPPAPALPEVRAAEKVQFALERLLHGPQPRTAAFRIDKLHQLNLEHARRDLAALSAETAQLLADPELIGRYASPSVPDRNPWHNLLDVVTALPKKDAALVLAWSAPTAYVVGDLPLQRRAVTALASVGDPATAPALLKLLRLRTRDRQLAVAALRALVPFGSPWREEALAVAYAQGDGGLWAKVPEALAGPLGSTDPGDVPEAVPAADTLAWWALLAQSAGPAPTPGSGRSERPGWMPVRLILDPSVWPDETSVLDKALRAGRVLAPATVLESGGFLARSATQMAGYALQPFVYDGREAVAPARCALARAGYEAYAADCDVTSSSTMSLEDAQSVLGTFLDAVTSSGTLPKDTGVAHALGVLHLNDPAAAVSVARRILVEVRPPDGYKGLLEGVGDLLQRHDPELLVRELTALAGSGDADDAAVALTLIRRARRVELVPAVEELLARAAPAGRQAMKQLLFWLYTADGASADAQAAFVRQYEGWVHEAGDMQARGLAPGLLDLGLPGAESYARGLRGERRTVYVQGLLQRKGIVRPVVALALLEGLDAETATAQRHAVLAAAYRTAPSEAAGALAAARARLPTAVRAEVDDIVESVRHRAGP